MTENTIETTENLKVFDQIQDVLNQTLSPRFVKLHTSRATDGVNSGFVDLDEITKGFHPGELTTIVVRPGIGKTAFLLSLVNNVAVTGEYSVGIISGRRPSEQIVSRLISSSTGLSVNKINSGELTDFEENKVNIALNNLYKANLYIDDEKNPSLNHILETVSAFSKGGVDIVFIDSLETIINTSTDVDCEDDTCIVMKQLGELVDKINIPVLLFSALKKPILYKNKYKYTPDSINDHSDSLIFLNRPDYYHINAIDKKEKGTAEVTIAKHSRITEPELISLRIIESLDKFVNPS